MPYENISVGVTGPVPFTGAIVAGTDEVQTLTLGGTPTGGTFRLALSGLPTADITWTATDATLITRINAALDARFGTAAIVATAGTVTAGIGTVILTFSGVGYAKRIQPLMTVASNLLTGTDPTLAIAETTPGVNKFPLYTPPGSAWIRMDTGLLYVANASGVLVAKV